MNPTLTTISSAGFGAALMYLLDPEMGRKRRALARDKMLKTANKTAEVVDATSRDIKNRAVGLVAEAKGRLNEKLGTTDGLEQQENTWRQLDFLQKNWSPATRFVAGAAGGFLALYGLRKTRLLGGTLTTAGLGILARAAMNTKMKDLMEKGISSEAARRAEEPLLGQS